jgi:hypothetical protein
MRDPGERTRCFALDISNLYECLPKTTVAQVLGNNWLDLLERAHVLTTEIALPRRKLTALFIVCVKRTREK